MNSKSGKSGKNKVAQSLQSYAVTIVILGGIAMIIMLFNDVSTAIYLAGLFSVCTLHLFMMALSEIISLLHDIKLNTEKSIETISEELPEL